MESNISSSELKIDKVMTSEQFDQIVEAILSGKYSWACVLILSFAGYNPLHYIPYRTYNRLKKDNRFHRKSKEVSRKQPVAGRNARKSKSNSQASSRLKDLSYVEDLRDSANKVNGGYGWEWLFPQF